MLKQITSFRDEYRFLSNFWPATVEFAGWLCPTVEHAYQAAKSDSYDERARIVHADTAGKAKSMGKRVKIRDDWEEIKEWIMFGLLCQKFADTDLARELRGTSPALLIEGNNWGDQYWGCTRSGATWEGQNKLGKMLMLIRNSFAF